MTPQAIRDGFAALRGDDQMHGLADAARSRSEADWLVGINGTRAMTAFNSRDGGFFLTTVGRVQTPTLAVVVEREERIRKFVSRDYWEIHASFRADAGEYPGKWFDPAWKKSDEDGELKADRVWTEREAQAIADAVRGQRAIVTEESKPTSQASPLLFDLTSLQREANGRFGFSAKTTLSIAQSLYERHKALTYPRTDSRALPEDYLPVVRETFQMLADSGMNHLAPHAGPRWRTITSSQAAAFSTTPRSAITLRSSRRCRRRKGFPKPNRSCTTSWSAVSWRCSSRRRSTSSRPASRAHSSTASRPKERSWSGQGGSRSSERKSRRRIRRTSEPVPVKDGETVLAASAESKALKTRPPARYSEATLLGAMEGAGKLVEDDELREAMQEKGLGTPATRAAIIEGLLNEKYMIREGRELIPTAKAFQLMTLLRGLGVEELSKPELTGEWEFKLAQMEHGKLGRQEFMHEIAEMTRHIVKKAKEYDHETVPGDYATLETPCPNCGGIVKENYRRYTCTGPAGAGPGCGFSFGKTPGGRTFETRGGRAVPARQANRSTGRVPF